MPRTIQADGRTIIVPDDATPEEINQIFGTAPTDPSRTAPQPSPGAPPSGLTRFVTSAWSPIKGSATGLYHAVTDKPAGTVENIVNALGPGALALKRTVVDPAIEQGREAISEFKQTGPVFSSHPTTEQLEHRQLATGHTLAAALPILGPWAAQVGEKEGEQLGTGDYAGAAGTAAGNIALAVSPKVLGPVARGLRETAAKAREGARTGTQSLIGAGEKTISRTTESEALKASNEAKTAIKTDRQAAAQHAADVASTRVANAEAVRAQGKIVSTQAKLESSVQEMQAQIETARNNALKEGNRRYNAVNKALNSLPADMEVFQTGLVDAMGEIKGSEVEPTILKAIGKRIEGGDVLTYEDLQGFYSELGNEISKGTLAGDIFQAYDSMHETIGKDMQRIADSQGDSLTDMNIPRDPETQEPVYRTKMGKQLYEARAYWRRMKQTFGKPYNPTDAANVVLEKTAGGVMRQAEQTNRLRLLSSFDKTIPQTAEHIANLQKGLNALPKEQPIRSVVKQLPEKPEATPIHAPEVNTRELRQQLVDKWSSGEAAVNKFQVRSLMAGGLGSIIGAVFGRGEGAAAGAIVGTVFGPAVIAKLVESGPVREWLTRPPAGELETLRKLPHADRIKIIDGLKRVVPAAHEEGIKVSPAVIALLAAGEVVGPKTRALQKTADESRQSAAQ